MPFKKHLICFFFILIFMGGCAASKFKTISSDIASAKKTGEEQGNHTIIQDKDKESLFLGSDQVVGREEIKNTVQGQPDQQEEFDQVKKVKYLLGPGDEIEIKVYQHEELNQKLAIDPSGKIIYPLVGEIRAEGYTIFELKEIIKEGLLKYLVDPQVGINLTSIQSQMVSVLGEVNQAGHFYLNRPLKALEAISMAAGFTSKANSKNVLLIRESLGKPEIKTLNLKKALTEGDPTYNPTLQKGDILYVPESIF